MLICTNSDTNPDVGTCTDMETVTNINKQLILILTRTLRDMIPVSNSQLSSGAVGRQPTSEPHGSNTDSEHGGIVDRGRYRTQNSGGVDVVKEFLRKLERV